MTPTKPREEPTPTDTEQLAPSFDDPRILDPPLDPRMDMSNDGDRDEPWDMPVEPPGL